jgi:hypothetical protein
MHNIDNFLLTLMDTITVTIVKQSFVMLYVEGVGFLGAQEIFRRISIYTQKLNRCSHEADGFVDLVNAGLIPDYVLLVFRFLNLHFLNTFAYSVLLSTNFNSRLVLFLKLIDLSLHIALLMFHLLHFLA